VPLLWILLSAAGGDVLEARLEASVVETAVAVRLDYRLVLPEDATRISFTAIEIGGARIDELSALEGDVPLEVELEELDGPEVRGVLYIRSREPGERRLSLRYRVSGKAIPVVVLDVPSREARARTFAARIQVSDGTRIAGSFPSNLVRSEDGAFVFDLPVVPRFISLRPLPRGTALRLSSLPGSFTGLFAAFGAAVLLYVLWMLWVERGERR
jgi:hypothetical protein